MNLSIYSEIPMHQVIEEVRKSPMLKSDTQFPYKNANISLRNVGMGEINPTSLYALKANLDFQKNLREYILNRFGFDTLRLSSGLILENKDGERQTLIPPIVEVSEREVKFIPQKDELSYENSYKIKIPCLLDGIHRALCAKELGIDLNVIFIYDSDTNYPVYAHPNEWDLVKICDSIPKEKSQKKMYLRDDHSSLYKSFAHLGSSGLRK